MITMTRRKLVTVLYTRLNRHKFNLIVKCFANDVTALAASSIVGTNRNTANRYYNYFRQLIIIDEKRKRQEFQVIAKAEADESYFGPNRIKGKRGRGAGGKTIVFGLLKRNGYVYTQILSDATKESVMPIIRKVVTSGSDIYTDGWRSYDALAVYGYNHKKVVHEDNEFAREDETHINGIESFWSWTKRRFVKFNGIPKRLFADYLLESKWRFNMRGRIVKELKRLLKRPIVVTNLSRF